MMRVSFMMTEWGYAGGYRIIGSVATNLLSKGYDVRLILPSQSSDKNLPTIPIEFVYSSIKSKYLSKIIQLWGFMKAARNTDIVIACHYIPALAAYLSRLFHPRSQGVLYWIQGYQLSDYQSVSKFAAYLLEMSYSLPVSKITASRWLKDQLWKNHGQNSIVINSFPDDTFIKKARNAQNISYQRQFPKRDDGRIQIACIGRSQPAKGFRDVIQAVNLLALLFPNIQLNVITQENLDTSSCDIPVKTIMPQNDTELIMAYEDADIFVYTSWHEGFGLPPIEAMACSVPVIITDCGGVREYARDGENCLIVPIRTPSSLADAMRRIIQDACLRWQMVEKGLDTVRNFSVQRATQELESTIHLLYG